MSAFLYSLGSKQGPTFICGTCKKKFACPSNLRRHKRIHSGIQPYACSVCQRLFKDCSNRNKHERSCRSRSLTPSVRTTSESELTTEPCHVENVDASTASSPEAAFSDAGQILGEEIWDIFSLKDIDDFDPLLPFQTTPGQHNRSEHTPVALVELQQLRQASQNASGCAPIASMPPTVQLDSTAVTSTPNEGPAVAVPTSSSIINPEAVLPKIYSPVPQLPVNHQHCNLNVVYFSPNHGNWVQIDAQTAPGPQHFASAATVAVAAQHVYAGVHVQASPFTPGAVRQHAGLKGSNVYFGSHASDYFNASGCGPIRMPPQAGSSRARDTRTTPAAGGFPFNFAAYVARS